jgi:hypothetical protein
MGLFSRLLGKQDQPSAATAETRKRSEALVGHPTAQTGDEQAATRARMEAELDAQRASRQGVKAAE